MGKIILGSSSPRRTDILKKINLDFEVIPSSYVENHNRTDFSYEFVEDLAYNKALYVAKDLQSQGRNDCIVIGADTIVVNNGKILGKPADFDEAFLMLKQLSGKKHFVVTAVSVVNSKDLSFKVISSTTYVTFKDLNDKQIKDYITEFKPYDKAGAYGIQELPEGFVDNVEGDLDNVIGLPSKVVLRLLEENIKK